jgi:cobalt-zinc-cadmium efflux system outer membrane protein
MPARSAPALVPCKALASHRRRRHLHASGWLVKRFHVLGCLLAAALMASGGAGAQPAAPDAVTWTQALDAAWQRSQERVESRTRLERAEAARTAARAPWAAPPTLELDHRTGKVPGNGTLRESEVGISVPVWLPGQKQSRADAADVDIQAAQRSVDAARFRMASELQQAALSVAAQEAETRQAELDGRLMRALAEDVDRRVRAGDLARADAIAARAEFLQAQASQQAAAQRLQQARDRWELLTGLRAIPAVPLHAPAGAQADHPELAAASARTESARRRLQVAERSRQDPPEMGVRVRREADNTGAASSVGVSLRVPLATADRNAPLLAQARGELELALNEEQRVRDRLQLEAQAGRLQVDSATRQLEAERARAALLRERADLIDKSFRAGESALPELLRALAAAAQADAAVLRQQAAVNQAQARLSQSLGIIP